MKLITINHDQDGLHDTDDIDKVTGSKIKVNRRNLVNLIAPEPLKVFEQTFTEMYPIVGPKSGQMFKVMDSKVKVNGTLIDGSPLTSDAIDVDTVDIPYRGPSRNII